MVNVTHEPFEEIVIKEHAFFDKIEDLAYIVAQFRASGAPVTLSWANGLVFFYSDVIPETDPIAEQFLKGRIYWTNVSYAEMPQYKPIFETRERVQVPIINLSSNPMIIQVMEWLKQQKKVELPKKHGKGKK